ncbi:MULTISPECIES: Na(+)-translocating NADH-quinone reductase subunit C [unclassified Oleiphilus]|uniref:Na(+)-translocating NADH-quinone reductase subunit C n=4 Tax=Oleiphilus TaxID=141450 RepID=UPI0007C22F90|nr:MULTISPECIES: Na(+)-translocating NADH-quinone reductase subunit C [unclassified Oleiphilus]KZY77952.1 NADH:ubiquinone reductase (Na(+)-transporting) subunit C [Oleiphilus sp. HI0068]KZY88438.1 NADH:ubiquinone reductase (Na(+)-transporting) subunit C [Oleiphilus sp. HI0069]KZY90912.1 NADH:ubiquinone reductase (Na(+)-transporting) subunit C [Oleiphilus sp. HI0072]KZZ13182.1 NADH:ubiquinone reductase (Na(+)-transporting) subunit C [Oleiphilus sp. HI0078]KZZ21543.1 NADH:ubiquinone reductase (N
MSSKETVGKTITVAFLLCIVCSIVVAGSVVLLKPIQEKNKALNLKANILAAAGLLVEGASATEIENAFSAIKPMLVDLDSGEYVEASAVNKENVLDYDQRKAAKDPAFSTTLSRADDVAGIKRRVKFAKIYLVEDAGKIETIILPVSGYGLWSTLHGFLALEGDANTVVGLGFYEHAETPGLGGEVDNPRWKAIWPGKKVYDFASSDQPKLGLIKGAVDKSRADAEYMVDGLSGATLTSVGVTNLIQYWTGEQGFQKYLNRLREGA